MIALETNQKEAKTPEEEERVQGWQKSQKGRREILERNELPNLNIKVSPIFGRLLNYTWIEGRGPQCTR